MFLFRDFYKKESGRAGALFCYFRHFYYYFLQTFIESYFLFSFVPIYQIRHVRNCVIFKTKNAPPRHHRVFCFDRNSQLPCTSLILCPYFLKKRKAGRIGILSEPIKNKGAFDWPYSGIRIQTLEITCFSIQCITISRKSS